MTVFVLLLLEEGCGGNRVGGVVSFTRAPGDVNERGPPASTARSLSYLTSMQRLISHPVVRELNRWPFPGFRRVPTTRPPALCLLHKDPPLPTNSGCSIIGSSCALAQYQRRSINS